MSLNLLCLLFLFLVSPYVVAQDGPRSRQQPLALTHVTVIDATGAPAKPDMTVVIDAGRIDAIGKSRKLRVPRNAEVINARGKFLIPGFWDMHVHIGDHQLDRNYLPLFIANGVTGIRVMEGAPEHHLWRRDVEQGRLLGPRMIIASAIIDGPKSYFSDAVKVGTEGEARAAVRTAKQGNADFVKVHDMVPREAYFALVSESRLLGLPFAGHVPQSITAAEAAEAGQRSVEHFTGLSEAETDASKADSVVAVFRNNGTWHCPTLIMRNNYASLDDAGLAIDPRLRYVKPSWRIRWLNMRNGADSVPASDWAKRKETVRREKALVGRMQRGGVGILAGTDDANPFVIPGFSLHDELVLLVESGLTPMQALQAATLGPAKFLYRLDSLGTVAVGKLADLVLLDANPLVDIHNTTRINAVVVNGRLLRRNSLDEILAQVEAAMKK